MYNNKKIVCVIPARGGSKGVPRKNVKLLNGRPLIAYAITAAKQSKYIDRVIVSTDDQEIARVSKKYGAEVPFIRPAELATDTAPTLPVLLHAVEYLITNEKYKPDIHVLIQPTSPFVLPQDIDQAIETLSKTKGANSCVSLCEINDRPEWMYHFSSKFKKPYIISNITRRQDMPKLYRLNGAVYVTKVNYLMKHRIYDNERGTAIIMPRERSYDIDEPIDFEIASIVMKKIKK